MAYTQEDLEKYYEELRTMSRCTGKPAVSMDELRDYMEAKEGRLQPGQGKEKAVSETHLKIKDMMLHDIGGTRALGPAFNDIKEANDLQLKMLAQTAAQKEEKLMKAAELKVIRDAKARLKEINDRQQDADAIRKGYGGRVRQPYAAAEDRRHYVGRGYWNPLRFLLAPINFGFHRDRHPANINYPTQFRDAPDHPIDEDYISYGIEHRTESGRLVGRAYEPDGWDQETDKVVLYFSGSHGPAGEYINNSCAEYIKGGAKVVSFDYRGFGHSQSLDKDGNVKGTRLSEESMYKDAYEMYNYVVNTMHVKPENIILHGYSLGGAIASRLAADVSEVNQIADTKLREKQGKVLSESMRLGGVVLQSPMDSNYKVASRYLPGLGYVTSGPLAWLADGGLNTKSHMQRLYKYDPNIPVYVTGGRPDKNNRAMNDHLSPEITRIGQDPKAPFRNMKVQTHRGGHESRMTKDDPNIMNLSRNGRKARLVRGLMADNGPIM